MINTIISGQAMLISLAVHLLLLMFELLVADNLQANRHLWMLVSSFIFSLLLLLSIDQKLTNDCLRVAPALCCRISY